MPEPWPRLSDTLPHLRAPDMCQQCGEREGAMFRWREHDDRDQPTETLVVLCDTCEAIIEPHPRLYSKLQRFEPCPGSNTMCLGCKFRVELSCKHPRLKQNGGDGLPIFSPRPGFMHINMGKKPHVMTWVWKEEPKCDGREERYDF